MVIKEFYDKLRNSTEIMVHGYILSFDVFSTKIDALNNADIFCYSQNH